MISQGYTGKSTKEPLTGQFWYLPHHGIYHPNKPRKIRVFFYWSSKYSKMFNREILPGPDLTKEIAAVLQD